MSKKPFLYSTCCSLVLSPLLLNPIDSYAAPTINGTITANTLNVRSNPSMDGLVLGKLVKNNKVEIIDEKNGWSKITYQHKEGWISSTYVQKESAKTPRIGTAQPSGQKTGTTAIVKASNLNVRSTAGTSGKVVASLPKNTKISILSIQGNWAQIKTANNQIGWVAKQYLTLSQTSIQPNNDSTKRLPPTNSQTVKMGTVNVSSLNLRSLPSTSGKIMASLSRNTKVTVLGVKSGWAQVKTATGQSGWVAAPYLTMKATDDGGTTEKPDLPSTKPTSPFAAVTLKSNANLRKGPGTNFAVVGSGKAGTTYTLVKEQNGWVNIKRPNNQEAWIAGWLVSKGNTPPSVPASPSPVSSAVLTGKTIVIDAGHGGKDSGTVGQKGAFEKDLALNTARLVVSSLEKAGANVIMTRSDDTFISLSDRVAVSHKYKADAFISIHYNSASPKSSGVMSFYYTAAKEEKLAKCIQESLVQYTNMKDMGVRFGNFHVIRENKQPAVLLELGFLSNPSEEQYVKSKAFQESAAKAISEGIVRYFQAQK
ncbi:SH3 domain-containing protein [Bacillus songklensis]|uniref:SH3 domain-containing protein n=1 Tax=Bacillus songklensis TaxID=1069116 RepID=A0ABV8B9R8_9BACI